MSILPATCYQCQTVFAFLLADNGRGKSGFENEQTKIEKH